MLALVLTALPLVVSAPPAEAAFPGANGKIAFMRNQPGIGTRNIYAMNTDGSDQTPLTSDTVATTNIRPAWSPDGTQIAFVRFDASKAEIYVMDADGSNQTRLTNNEAPDTSPAWSPDGTQIAFASSRDGGESEIYVMSASGANQTRLTSNDSADSEPAWSPNGRQIAFVSQPEGSASSEIYVMSGAGTDPTRLTFNFVRDRAPAWSPDGSKIALHGGHDSNEIYVMNADGEDRRLLPTDGRESTFPAWSPDGRQIAFGGIRDGTRNIFVVGADGSDLTRLADTAGFDGQPTWQPVAPDTTDDQYGSVLRTEEFVSPSSVLDNDEPGNWTVELVDDRTLGELELNLDGSFVYRHGDPALAEAGTFTYQICVSRVLCSEPTTVTLNLEPVLQTDVVADAVTCDLEQPCRIDVLANDLPTGRLLLDDVEAVGDPHGVFDFTADGTFGFTPAADHPGGDSEFTYTAAVPTASGGRDQVSELGVVTATVHHTTTMELDVDPADPAEGDVVEITAIVTGPDAVDGDPSGSVEFFDGDDSLGTAELASPAVLTVDELAVGDHVLTAVYQGDEGFAPVTSDPVIVTVAVAPDEEPGEDTTTTQPSVTGGTGTPTLSGPGVATATPQPTGSTSNSKSLASTGATSLPLVAVAAGLLTLGALLTAGSRRRRRHRIPAHAVI